MYLSKATDFIPKSAYMEITMSTEKKILIVTGVQSVRPTLRFCAFQVNEIVLAEFATAQALHRAGQRAFSVPILCAWDERPYAQPSIATVNDKGEIWICNTEATNESSEILHLQILRATFERVRPMQTVVMTTSPLVIYEYEDMALTGGRDPHDPF